MRRVLRWIAWLLVLALLAAGLAYVIVGRAPTTPAQRPGRAAMMGGGPVPVLAAQVRRVDVPIRLDAVGTVQALNTVTVRPQVEGQLIWIGFREGQDVRKGDLLAQIDPAAFKAALDQAEAKKAQDQANLANARIDLDRYARLARTDYATKQQADTQRALVAQLEAQVRADQAAIDAAKTQLGYATMTAPIDGRTGLRLVDEGNIVGASTTAGIVTLTQVQPISILFTMPQQFLRQVNAAFAAGPVPADAVDSDNRTVLDQGRLEVVDNQVDVTTGTVKMKATFPNPGRLLWPGQFVNVRLQTGMRKDALVVPAPAVQRGPTGTVVYVIGENDTVAVKPVTVVQQDEMQAVLGDGLAGGERVVTSGFTRLTNGSKVQVSAPATAPDAGAGGPRGPGQGGRGRRGQQQGGAGEAPAAQPAVPPGGAPAPADPAPAAQPAR
ncbi:MAG: efflux RND transporter periplasmic adaptor subunit [Alphaproteobacteria bacterium]|nr:efflux RND transporter periplasmic adaptor subunit [Alphaproteobacteria bacterium]